MKNITAYKLYLAIVFALYGSNCYGQSDITTWNSAKINGSLNMTGTNYSIWGSEARRDPYFWRISANLNAKLGPVALPFSANISAQNKGFRYPKPFNSFGISPSYKELTAHIGYRSLNFSELTYGGTEFLGGGLSYKSESLPIEADFFYGRLQKAGLDRSFTGTPLYKRMGWGSSIGYVDENATYKFVLFKAKDDPSSLVDSISALNEITPAENLVLGFILNQKVTDRLTVNLHYALSVFTADVRNPEIIFDRFTYINNFGNLFTPRASTRSNGSFIGSLVYATDNYQFNLGYRYVSPDYITLGALYITNDFEDIIGGVSVPLLNNKLNISVNGGVQRNDLKNERSSSTKRVISNIGVNYSVNNQFNLGGSFANFNTSTQMEQFIQSSNGIELDTVTFRQVNLNANLNASYNFSSGSITQGVSGVFTFQNTSDSDNNSTRLYNLNMSYRWSSATPGISFNLGVSGNNNYVIDVTTFSWGPTASLGKSFLKNKLRNSLNFNYLRSTKLGEFLFTTWNLGLSSAYTLTKKQNITFNGAFINRISEQPNISELRLTLNYNYRF